jgi:DNA polymerase III delta subunit
VAHVHLVASPDDFLLERHAEALAARVCEELGGVEPEIQAEDVTPERLAVELCSPSLFAPQRVLVVEQASSWLAQGGTGKRARGSGRTPAAVDVAALVQVVNEGLSDDIALILVAQCPSKPKGPLMETIDEHGHLHWHPVPPPPKPWEEGAVSDEQAGVLRAVIRHAAGEVAFSPSAERLLFERLGFAPRMLAQEARKLAAAATGATVDEELVRRLSFPKERSIEAAREALLGRRPEPLLDLLSAAAGGHPVRDYQGRMMTGSGLPFSLVGLASTVFQQLLYLRLMAARHGLLDELDPRKTDADFWYPRRFKNDLGPTLQQLVADDGSSPLAPPRGRKPALFALIHLFRGAGRYSDDDLVRALADLGQVEASIRGDGALEALSVYFSRVLSGSRR